MSISNIDKWTKKIDEIIYYITLYDPECKNYEECENIILNLIDILTSYIKDPNLMTIKYDNISFTKNSYNYLKKELYDNLLKTYDILLDSNDFENHIYINYAYESIHILSQLFEYKKDICLNKHKHDVEDIGMSYLSIRDKSKNIDKWKIKAKELIDLYILYEPDCSSYEECILEIQRVNLIIILFIVKGLDYTDSTNLKYKLNENDLKNSEYLKYLEYFKDIFWMFRIIKKKKYAAKFNDSTLNMENKKRFITDYFKHISEPKKVLHKQLITDYFKPKNKSTLSQTKITQYYKPDMKSVSLSTDKSKITSYFTKQSK
jgi:hypothetical protein